MRSRLLTSQFRFWGSKRFCHEQTVEKMTQRTYDQDAPWPPMKENSLRLYSMRFCPYAQRARLVLHHKHIQYETINVHLKRKPPWLLERNPKGRVPVLEHPDGRIVYESLVVSQYLDDIFPQHRLTPPDPYRHARDRLLPEFCDKFMRATYQLLFTEGQSEEARVTYLKGFRIYEAELTRRLPDGPFFGGHQPAMVDYMLWPWFERIPMMSSSTDDKLHHHHTPPPASNSDPPDNNPLMSPPVGVDASLFPLLHGWMVAMFQLPAVKATMFDLRAHGRFGRSQLTADPEYDMGLEEKEEQHQQQRQQQQSASSKPVSSAKL